MKRYLVIMFLFAGIALKAQPPEFKVDCGNDTFFCVGLYPNTFHIGSQIKLTNGVAPYKYAWSCKPIKITSNITFTASDYLNDTTISNPYLKDYGVTNHTWGFYLTVIDNDNNIATDSIFINCSRFVYKSKEYDFYLDKGDSIQFYDEIFVGEGISPVKYYWTPSFGLDDSTKINAWCKPNQSTSYYQYIIDSAKCKSIPNKAYNVYIIPASIKNIKDKSSDFLDLHQNGKRLVFKNPLNKLAKLSFYSIDGKIIYANETNNSFFDISHLMYKGNIIICVLRIEGIISALKIY